MGSRPSAEAHRPPSAPGNCRANGFVQTIPEPGSTIKGRSIVPSPKHLQAISIVVGGEVFNKVVFE